MDNNDNANVNRLFPHQEYGVDWLAATDRGLLADDPGLGKTAQAIVAADKVGAKKLLVVCPTAVTDNWVREIERWSPTRAVQLLRTGRAKVCRDTVVVSHGLLLSPGIFEQLTSQRWDVVTVDEAHGFRNPDAKRTVALYGLSPQLNKPAIVRSATRTWALTGTPMPNNPTELWSMLRGLAPERIMAPDAKGHNKPLSWYGFRDRFCETTPVPFGDGVKIVGARNVDDLKARLRGFLLRRRKSDHLQLPPVLWGTVQLTVDELPPALVELEAKLGLHGSPEERLAQLRDHEEFSTWRRLCGVAKAQAAVELLADELREDPTKKVVVFAHHAEVVATLTEGLAEFGSASITGATPGAERQAIVDRFQTTPSARVVVCNIVAGGVGITLTAARDVAMVEQSFVPGDNVQAADRCHRIGQTGTVSARVLSLAGSVDALVAEILVRKVAMIREVLGA